MSLYATILEQLSSLGLNGTAALVGGMVAVGIVVTTCLIPRRRSVADVKFPPRPTPREVDAATRTGQSAERRSGARRGGEPTPIFLTDVEGIGTPLPGWVLDRSTGGLGLLLDQPLATDTHVTVRSLNAPATTPWVPLRVRYCRPMGDGYQIGCQYGQNPPWHVRLLFG